MSYDEAMPATPAPDQITVQQLDDLVKEIFEKKKEIESQELITTSLNKELASLQMKCVSYLKALEKSDYKCAYGNVAIQKKWRVNMPQTDEDKRALFDWLREKGIFDKFATVNSQSLNSLYMAEWEAAKRAGTGLEFTLPGIGERKLFEGLGMRKGTKGESDE